MQIGEIAAATGISRDTLRFYEKRGLLAARRGANGYRDYPPDAVEWLRYIRTAQQLGFTLKEIEADLPLLAAPQASAARLRAALQAKVAEIDRRIARNWRAGSATTWRIARCAATARTGKYAGDTAW